MCRHSFASHRLMRGALSLCSCFRASDPALFAVDRSLLRTGNCSRRRPVCEEKDDDTQSCHRLSPRTLAELSGVLFKERYLIKPTLLRHLISKTESTADCWRRPVQGAISKSPLLRSWIFDERSLDRESLVSSFLRRSVVGETFGKLPQGFI
jgi:hypothetical protein